MNLDTRLALLRAAHLVISNYTMTLEPSPPGQVLNGYESCARLRNLDSAVAMAAHFKNAPDTFRALASEAAALLAGFFVTDTSHGPQQVLGGVDTWNRLFRLQVAANNEADDIALSKAYSDSMTPELRASLKGKS